MNPNRAVALICLISVVAGLLLLWAPPYTALVATAAVLLAAMAVLNLRVGGTALYPPALYCGVWALLLTILLLTGDYFYPLSLRTLSFYVIAAASFSLGGWFTRPSIQQAQTPLRPTPMERRGLIDRILTVGVVIFVFSIPFYWRHTQDLISTSSFATVSSMVAIRDALIRSGQESGAKQFSQFLFDSLWGFSILISYLACMEERKTAFQKWRYFVLIAVSLYFNLGTAGRVGAFLLLVGLVMLSSLRRGRIEPKLIMGGILAFCLAFAPAAVLMNKGGDVRWTVSDNALGIAKALGDYSLGGVVAFDRIVENPDAIPPVWRISRSFLQMAGRIGFDVDVPSIHAEFTGIRPGGFGNVYTIYFAYLPDFGWVGTMFMLFALGAVVTWIFRRAVGGSRVCSMLFGLLGCYVMLSGFSENFFSQMNFNIKCAAVAWTCYAMPLFWLDPRRSKVPKTIRQGTGSRLSYPRRQAAPAQSGSWIESEQKG